MRILYATDGSEGACAAGRFLTTLPLDAKSHVHIVTIVDEGDTVTGEQNLETARNAMGAFPGQITSCIGYADGTGSIVETLLWSAEYRESDLIVTGARGRSALDRFLLGSIAEGLARHSPIPVLIARTGNVPIGDVVIGVDGSGNSFEAAFWTASSLPLPPACTLRLVRAVQMPLWANYPPIGTVFPDAFSFEDATDALLTPVLQVAEQSLEAVQQELRTRGWQDKHQVVMETPVGHAATELLAAAQKHHSGLVVVGSRGLTGISRFLLGSVSADVIHHAPCSVLIMKHPQVADKTQERKGDWAV